MDDPIPKYMIEGFGNIGAMEGFFAGADDASLGHPHVSSLTLGELNDAVRTWVNILPPGLWRRSYWLRVNSEMDFYVEAIMTYYKSYQEKYEQTYSEAIEIDEAR